MKTKPLHILKPVLLISLFLISSTLYGQRPGIECGCVKYGQYVTPAVASPAMGQTLADDTKLSPKGKYRVTASYAPPPNTSHLAVYDTENGALIYNISSILDEWGFDPTEKYFVIKGYDGSSAPWVKYLILDPDKSITGERATEFWICTPAGELFTSLVNFSPHGNYILHSGITGDGFLMLHIYKTATGEQIFDGSSSGIATADTAVSNAGWGFSPDEKDATFVNTYLTDVDSYALFVKRLDAPENEFIIQAHCTGGAYWRFSPCGDYFAWIPDYIGSRLEVSFYSTASESGVIATADGEFFDNIEYTKDGHFVNWNALKYPVDLSMANQTCPDETAPTWPDGAELSMTDSSGTRVVLHWPPALDSVGVSAYRVYVGEEVIEEIGKDTAFIVKDLEQNIQYTLGVKAGDETGNWSSKLTKEFRTPEDASPEWPGLPGITYEDLKSTEVKLNWTPATDDFGVEGYAIFMDLVALDTIFGESTYKAINLISDTNYTFSVEAYDAANQWTTDGPSVTIFTPEDPFPTWPQGSTLSCGEVTETSILLIWPEADDEYYGVTGYKIYRDGELIHPASKYARQYDVTGLEEGTTYHFAVVAEDVVGNKSDSLISDFPTLSPFIEKALVVESGYQGLPDIDGRLVVWQDNRNGNADIFNFELTTGTEDDLITDLAWQGQPVSSDGTVVWTDLRNGDSDIYMYDKYDPLHRVTPICEANGDQVSPAIDGNIVVWSDYRSGNWDIYMYNLLTKEEKVVCNNSSSQVSPDISGNIIVWEDTRNGDADIYAYNIGLEKEFVVCVNSGEQRNPAIEMKHPHRIVWQDNRKGDWDIYMEGWYVNSNEILKIYLNPSGNQTNPDIEGNTLVYQDDMNGSWDIYAYKLKSTFHGDMEPICQKAGDQINPRTSKERIVWEDRSSDDGDIYIWDRPPGSDLSISLEEKEDPVTVGEDIVYKLNIENAGPDDADSVKITCSLPLGLVLKEDTIPGFESSQIGNTLVCKIPVLAADSSLTFTLTFSTRNTGVINFSAEVEGRVFDPDPSNNRVTETTDVSLLVRDNIPSHSEFGMDLTSDGTTHLAYRRHDSLFYARKTKYSGWIEEYVDFLVSDDYYPSLNAEYQFSDIIVDRSGRVHIAQSYVILDHDERDSSYYYLYYYVKNGSNWDKSLLRLNQYGFDYIDLELAANDELHLAYTRPIDHHHNHYPLFYMTTQNQNWLNPEQISIGMMTFGMTVDSNYEPHLSFYWYDDYLTHSILHLNRQSTGDWTSTKVIDPEWPEDRWGNPAPRIGLDEQNNPHIFFTDATANRLRIASKVDDGWEFMTVASGPYVGSGRAIHCEQDSLYHILYHDNGQFVFAFNHSNTWIRQNIADWGGAWANRSLAYMKKDSEGNYHITYGESSSDFHTGDIKYIMIPSLPYIIADVQQLNFGIIEPGETMERKFLISNPGSERVYIDELTVLESNSFTINTEHPFLDPGKSDTVRISYSPQSMDFFNGKLRIRFNGTEKMFIDVELIAMTSMPILQLDYESREFNAPVGGSDTCRYHISNKGNLPLEISNIKLEYKFGLQIIPTDFDIISQDCFTVGPGDSCVIVIAFSPRKDKNQYTTLYIYSNDFVNPELSLGLKGYIAKPYCLASPYDLGFGYVPLGSTLQKEVIISNSGKATLDISSIEIEGYKPEGFSVSHSCTTLEPDESCPLYITFHPGSNDDFEAELHIRYNLQHKYVELKGSTYLRELSITPEIADFGMIELGDNSKVFIEVTNTGEAAVEDITVDIKGPNRYEFIHTGHKEILQVGETFIDSVWFKPQFEGEKLAEWIIEYDIGFETSDTVPLTGIGLGEPGPLRISAGADPLTGMIPLEVNFYSTATGGSLVYNFSWDFGDGSSDSSEDPVHTYQQPGKYWASVSVSDDEGSSLFDSVQILVGADLVPVVKIYAYREIKGTLLDVQFTSEILGGRNPLSILWDFGDGTISTIQNPQHSYTAEGDYEVYLLITDDRGTTAEDNTLINFTLHNLSLAVNAYSEDDTLDITAGLTELFISGIPEPLADYMFSGEGFYTFNNLIRSDYSIKVTPDTIAFPDYLPTYLGGWLTLSEADYLYLDKGIDTVDIYCVSKPLPGSGSGIISGIVIDAIGEKALKLAYNYNGDDPPVPETMVYLTNANSETLVAFDRTTTDGHFDLRGLNDGLYNLLVDYKGVRMSENNAAIQVDASNRNIFVYALVSDDEITLEEVTGLKDDNSLTGVLNIYPNPVQDNIYLKFDKIIDGKITIRLLRIDGTVVNEIRLDGKQADATLRIPVSDLSKGVYILNVKGKDINYQSKIVKQ